MLGAGSTASIPRTVHPSPLKYTHTHCTCLYHTRSVPKKNRLTTHTNTTCTRPYPCSPCSAQHKHSTAVLWCQLHTHIHTHRVRGSVQGKARGDEQSCVGADINKQIPGECEKMLEPCKCSHITPLFLLAPGSKAKTGLKG